MSRKTIIALAGLVALVLLGVVLLENFNPDSPVNAPPGSENVD